jgi:transposase-like protein
VRLVCSPIDLDRDGAILHAQEGGAPWAISRGKRLGGRSSLREFKRGVVQQIVKGEKTLAEVSRELDIQPTVIRQWKRRVERGAATAVAADEDVVPASLAGGAGADQGARAEPGAQADGDRDPAGRPGDRKKVRGCAKGPGSDGPSGGSDLPGAADRAADGLLRASKAP